ncbi:hypothetical protein TTHERM_00475350 (macronuclear) [Tetrahymena thermophila SB210]|uniref:Kinetochore protein NDC80 n=1 Tax=Tetrahymena thermophila (strain SB210) TaxID=312017 RepID=I7LX51_TETTS|nr:hypothetical protein TTHERM_00475350 [Tetrahymena thermophila SB210]EAS03772.2 hypothetical protein TTHERM_00475350 [Tetrahymena thermophila SB210]|eukprot:XP_001024017.2 hypothetical protein TTHERM_00475350 [Tetrahymena thermophila SB210]
MRHTEFFRGPNDTSDSGSSKASQKGNYNANYNSDKLNQSMNFSSIRMTNLNQPIRNTVIQNTYKKDGNYKNNLNEKNIFILQDLLSFINLNIYQDSPISEQQLKNPTQKIFFEIFWGFIRIIDPSINSKVISVDEIPQLMKFWNCPFQLNKNILTTIGAPHTLKQTQNLLFWLYQLSKEVKSMSESLLDNQKSILQNSQSQSQRNDMEILNQYIAQSFRRKDNDLLKGANFSKHNSSKKNPQQNQSMLISQIGMSEDEKEAKDIADLLKQKNIYLQQVIKELELKIETLQLSNKNLCLKQPDLSEVGNKIEQQQDVINMEQELIYQLSSEIESNQKDIDNYHNIFNEKMIAIHELEQEKSNIQKQITDQEYSIVEAEKKLKEIERLKKQKAQIDLQISQTSDQRTVSYTQNEGQINEIHQLINDYNRILNTSNELFIQCQGIEAFVNEEKIRADNLDILTKGLQIKSEDLKQGLDSFTNSKNNSKIIIKSMINIDLKKVSEQLKAKLQDYQVSVVKQEESIKQINRQIEEKKTNINDLDIKINQLNIKSQQKQDELKQLIQLIQDRQVNFKHKSEEQLQANSNIKQQINQSKQKQFSLENDLTNFMNQIEVRKKLLQKEKEESIQILENQAIKINQAKQQIILKFQQLHSYYQALNKKSFLINKS